LTIFLVAAAVIYLVLTALGTLWTDYLWFDSIGYNDVWQRRWGVTILLGVVGIAVAFLVLWVNLQIVDRLSPRWAPFDLTEEEELVERFREWIAPRVRQVRFWVTAVLAVILGVTVASWRDQAFLFFNSTDFGVVDPVFEQDIGFYLFRVPAWDTLLNWLFNLLVLTVVVVIIAHYFNGGIRFAGRRFTTTRGPKVHISILLALLALVRAAVYRVDMFQLTLSNRAEGFFGPGYTDIMARLPALKLLILVALAAAVLFIVNIFRPGWLLAFVAVGSWLVVSIAAGAIYPAIIERFQVTPTALAKETPYIEDNLAFTKAAWGLDNVDVREFAANDDLGSEDIAANSLTIDNLRMWDTSVLPRTYQNFQELRPYYTLGVVDTDRYLNEGTPTQVMIAVRELEENALPGEGWQNERLFYTHGLGAVVNVANVVGSGGQPDFLLKDVPPVAVVPALELEQPRIYFGETYTPGRPVIVMTGTSPQEIDVPGDGDTQRSEYDGAAGVTLDSLWKRIAFAFRYRDLNLLISSEIRPDSRVLVERNIEQILKDVAPFLQVDTDPYPVIVDGRIKWVVDLYTTSNYYPYSQPLTGPSLARLNQSSGLRPGINYMRNSVKAVIDAYDGDVTFYLVDEEDPVARAWSASYPGLLQSGDDLPEELQGHLRYPQDLFRVQGELYLKYHVDDPTELYTGNDVWSIPEDLSTPSRSATLGSGDELLFGDLRNPSTGSVDFLKEVLPYYLLTRLPGEQDLSYLLLQPFTPLEKRNMSGFLVADSNPDRYGRLVDFRMPQGQLVDGPAQVAQRIEQDAEIAQQLTLWRGAGSNVITGDLLVVPVEDSLIYIQPFFLEEEGGAFPEFRRVAVVYGAQVEWAETLDGALDLVFGDGGPSQEPTGPDGETVAELLDQAAAAFAAADDALQAGDLAEYQAQIDEAHRLIEEARSLLEEGVEARFAGEPAL
jgi:uncharacterized membrane protein (UPF0182 family)